MKKLLALLLALMMLATMLPALAESGGSEGEQLSEEEQAARAAQEALFNSPLDFQLIEADEKTVCHGTPYK